MEGGNQNMEGSKDFDKRKTKRRKDDVEKGGEKVY